MRYSGDKFHLQFRQRLRAPAEPDQRENRSRDQQQNAHADSEIPATRFRHYCIERPGSVPDEQSPPSAVERPGRAWRWTPELEPFERTAGAKLSAAQERFIEKPDRAVGIFPDRGPGTPFGIVDQR